MRRLSTGAELARKRPWAAPRYLVQIDFTAPSAKTLRLSDQYSSALGQEWLPLVADWGTLDEALNTVDAGGRPTTAEITLFNTKPIEGKARISDLIRTNINVTGTYEWMFAKLTVYQLFDGLVSGDENPLGVFLLEEPSDLDEELLTVRMADESLAIEDKINVTVVNRVDFPNCADSAIGQSIPRPFGAIAGAVAIPVVDSITSRLNGGITSADTTLTLDDASRFASSGTVQIDTEHLSYTGKTATTLTGLTRAADSTTAALHKSRATVYEVRQGATNAYRYAAGENIGGFLIRNLKNILVNGEPPTQTPSIELAASIGGKSLAVINFPREAKFFKPATVSAERDVAVSTVTVAPLNGGATSSQTRTVTPSSIGGTTSTDRSMNCRVVRSNNTAGTINYWHVLRRLSGGTDVQVAAGSFAANVGGTQSFSDTRTYASTADEIITFEYQYNNTNDGKLELIFDNYHVKDSSSVMAGGGPTDIGEVSVEIEGLQDDSSGTISGTPSLLLENCTDITRFIMTQLYPVAAASLGIWWAPARAAHVSAAYRWAFLLTFTQFSQLRRKLGEQARSVLYLEGGLWQYKFLADDPRSDVTFDYLKDVTRETPVRLSRTKRANIKNSLVVQAAWDNANSFYRYVTIKEDLTQPGLTDRIQDTLTLDFVQDTAVADAIGAYWLGQWKQQRFFYELEAMWNAIPVEAIDYLRIANHPILTAFGGVNLIGRVIGKRYSPKTDTIRLQAIEAASIVPPPPPGEETLVSTNYVFNGDIEIWGAGTAARPTGWTLTGAAATVAKNTTAGQFKLSTASAALTRAGTDCYLSQDVSVVFGPAAWWQGKSVTIGCWVRATVAARARIGVNDGVGTTFSSYHSGGSGFEFLTVTRVIDNAATKVEIRLQVDTGDTTAQFDGATLIQGLALGDFFPGVWIGRKAILRFDGNGVGSTTNSTQFIRNAVLVTTPESAVADQVPFKGVLRNLTVSSSVAAGAGQSYTYTARKNLADTALTCAISGASAVATSDVTHEAEYAKLDTFDIKVVSSVTAASAGHYGMAEYEEIPVGI